MTADDLKGYGLLALVVALCIAIPAAAAWIDGKPLFTSSGSSSGDPEWNYRADR